MVDSCHERKKSKYPLAHHVPVALFETRIAQASDQWHVNLKRLQLLLDVPGCLQRASELWVLKLFSQLVRRAPEILHLRLYENKYGNNRALDAWRLAITVSGQCQGQGDDESGQ